MTNITSIQQIPGDNLVQKLERFGEGQIPTWHELGFMLRCVERAAILLEPILPDDSEFRSQFNSLVAIAKRAVINETLPGDCEELGEKADALSDLIPEEMLIHFNSSLKHLIKEGPQKNKISIIYACINSLEGLFWFMAGAIDFHCVADSTSRAAQEAGSGEAMTNSLVGDFDQLAFQGKSYPDLDVIPEQGGLNP